MEPLERRKFIEAIQNFRLIDDTFFNIFMDGNKSGMELFLRLILDDASIQVNELLTQREVPNIYGRNVRFDMFVTDNTGTEYNIEVQRDPSGAGGERARFNSCMLDSLTISKGFQWGKDHLPPAKVIFLTEHDPYGAGKPLYHAWRTIHELNHLRFDDAAEIIYVNTSWQNDSPLGLLMQDMYCQNPEDMHYRELAERASYLKSNDTGVSAMCEAMEKLVNDGVAKGFQEAEENIVIRMQNKGKTVSDIQDALGWTADRIVAFLQSRNLRPIK